MSLERQNPIPPGIYWVDTFKIAVPAGPDQRAQFSAWRTQHAETVKVLRTQTIEATGGNPDYEWVLFQVLEPTWRWGTDTHLGFPTRAPKGAATTEEDTVQRPPPGGEESALPWGWIIGGAVVGGLIWAGAEWVRKEPEHEHEDHR